MKPTVELDEFRARQILRRTSIQILLETAYQLTHRMHCNDNPDLRAQRDLITKEIVRRIQGPR